MTAPELARLFRKERRVFARRFPAAGRAALYVAPKPAGLPRRAHAFALTNPRRAIVVLYTEALRLPRRNILGLVRHELGHVSDVRVNSRGREQRADDIAHLVTGQPIRYEGRHAVQSVGRGVYPRPSRIHA